MKIETPGKILGKWIDSLRTGKYKNQSRGQLCSGGGYCVLGVLCDVSGMGSWNPIYNRQKSYKIGDETELSVLPESLAKHLDIPRRGYKIPRDLLTPQDLKLVEYEEELTKSNPAKELQLDYLNDVGVSFENLGKYILAYCELNSIEVEF